MLVCRGRGALVAGFFRSHRDCYLYLFFCCLCISNSSFMGILYRRFFLVGWDYCDLWMYRRILDRELHVGHVVLGTPISGACIRLCQICLLLPEVELRCFILRLLSLPGATFPSLWLLVLIERCPCSGVRLIGFEGSLHTCVIDFRHIGSAIMSMDVQKS